MVMLKFLGFLISFVLLTNFSMAQSSGPKMIQVSPDEMQKLILRGYKNQTILLAQRNQTESDKEQASKKKKDKKNKDEDKDRDETDGDFYPNLGIDAWMSSSSNDEAALIVFAVVGLVMIIAWVPYFPVLAYKAIKNKEDHDLIHLLSMNYVLTQDRSLDDQYRYRNVSGLRYSLFIKEKDSERSTSLGFATELGYYHYRLKDFETNEKERLEGGYWLLGPAMLFGTPEGKAGNIFGKIELLAGTSFDSDLGLVTKADLSGNVELGAGLSFGLGLGALYIDLKNSKGLLQNTDELSFMVSTNLSYAFQ